MFTIQYQVLKFMNSLSPLHIDLFESFESALLIPILAILLPAFIVLIVFVYESKQKKYKYDALIEVSKKYSGSLEKKKIDKKEAIADWNMTAEQMIAKIKGLNPSPGVWFMHKSARIKIIRALETNHKGRPGEVLDDELTIACKENSIKISLLQKEGKKKMRQIGKVSVPKEAFREFLKQ